MARAKTAFTGAINPNQNYVYYQHLLDNPVYERFGQSVRDKFMEVFASSPDIPDMEIVQKLRTMGETERQKEKEFIRFTFGFNPTFDLDATNTRDFIDAFNGYMQVKEIYEARKILLMRGYGTGAKGEEKNNLKDAYSWFNTYYESVFEAHLPEIAQYFKENFDINTLNEKTFLTVMKKFTPKLVEEAIDRMMNAKGNSGLSDSEKQKVKQGYEAIGQAIEKMGKSKFGQMIIQELNLNTLNKEMYQTFKDSVPDIASLTKAMQNSIKSFGGRANIGGGIMLELVENATVSAFAKEIAGKRGISVQGIHTGNTGGKADNAYVVARFEIAPNMKEVANAINDKQSTSREDNIKAIDKLDKVLNRGNEKGYIVYTSAKNYFRLHKNGKDAFTGETAFSGGAAQSLANFSPILERITNNPGKVDALLQGVMQTIPGAIGPDQKHTIEEKLAQYFAYFLFDDLDYIGEKTGNTSYDSIHLMNLNGIFVPLSVLLLTYAAALEKEISRAIRSPSAIAKVTISTPSTVMFDYYDKTLNPPPDAWQQQRQEAFKSINVHVSFLKSLREIISGVQI